MIELEENKHKLKSLREKLTSLGEALGVSKLEGEIKRVNGKLSNQGFLAKAPESLVNEEKAKKEKFEEMMKSVL